MYYVLKNCQGLQQQDFFLFVTLPSFLAHHKDNQSLKKCIQGILVKFFECNFSPIAFV